VPPAEGQRYKRFRLSIVGAAEAVPRVIRANGRACDGEFGLVMRPPEPKAVLVLVQKDGNAAFWKGDQGDKSDSPLKPILTTTPADAVAQIKSAQKSPPKVGPVTLRGRWTGYLYCEGGQPRVELKRKLATYGTLWVFSNGTDGWAWTFERAAKWFGSSGETSGRKLPTLLDAIQIAVLGAMKLVQDACGFRDTRRRAAHDEAWADKYPIKKREPKRNPTERLKEKPPKKARKKKASAPKPKRQPAPKAVNTRDAAPEVPQDRGTLQTMADTAARAAHDLVAVDDVSADWELVASPPQIAAWFDEQGFQGIGEAILDYAHDPTYPVDEFLADVRKDLKAAETVHDDDPDPKLYAEARDKLAELSVALESAPVLLERARKLIRYARSMARSPLCQGAEQKAALKAVDEARAVYEKTRAKIRKGHKWDADRTLRRVGEKVALAAARAAKSCASGQVTLPTSPPAKPAPKKPRKKAAGAKKKKTGEVDADKDQALIDAFSKAFAALLGEDAA